MKMKLFTIVIYIQNAGDTGISERPLTKVVVAALTRDGQMPAKPVFNVYFPLSSHESMNKQKNT